MMQQRDRPDIGDRMPKEPGRFGWLKNLMPENSSIPRLSAEAWKIVMLKLIERIPPWGLVVIIWTMVAMFLSLLIVRELSK